MITLPRSRAAERPDAKDFPSRPRRRGGARYQGALAVAAAALVAYACGAVEAGSGTADPVPDEAHASRQPLEEGAFDTTEESRMRIALVIGNGNFEGGLAHDPSALADAAGVGAALERLGFRVRVLQDVGYVDMIQGLLEFSRTAQSARAAVVFYAGPGHEVDGRNYLIPVDTSSVAFEAALSGGALVDVTEGNLGWVPVTWLLRSVGGASHLRLVVLDTDVPAPLGPVGETTVAQAAVAGTWAASAGEADAHSPYTEALLRYLEEPALELGMLFRKVRHDVLRASDGRQEPVVYGLPGHGTSFDSLSDQPPLPPPPSTFPGVAEAHLPR